MIKVKYKTLSTLLVAGIITLLVQSCGKERTGFFAKRYHNTTARYNRYYHGTQILEEVKDGLKQSHKDDFNEVLKIYALGDVEGLGGNASQMDEIVKKAANIIDKHPRSKWIDNTYMLIGKSHFYRGDFFSAIDVFNFVFSKYRDPKIKSEAQFWVAKSYFLQEKYLEAEALLTKIEIDKEPTRNIQGELYLISGAVALEQNKYGQAAALIENAIPNLSRKQHDLFRYHYILGQLYELSNNTDSAIQHYQKVKKFNPPYAFEFNSKLNSAKLLNGRDNNKAEGILKRMLKDDKNIDFYDQIYYELAQINLNRGDKINAIKYFEQSVASGSNNKVQKSNTFLALGDLFFEIPNYEKSQTYYDSAGLFLDESHPKFEEIAQKNEVLGDLIQHLITIRGNDSLLRMATDESFREKVIDDKIERKEVAMVVDDIDPNDMFRNQAQTKVVNSSFPFYNPVAKGKGFNDFVAKWGRRAETDNWRISSLQREESLVTTKTNEEDSVRLKEQLDANLPDVPEDRKPYYVGIPFSAAAQSGVNGEIESALFEAGKIYKDGLFDYPEAIKQFQILLERYPKSKFAPACHYYKMICYQNLDEEGKANEEKQILITKYPEDDYTNVATGKNQKEEVKELDSKAEKLYLSMYNNYNSAKYQDALLAKKLHDEEFMGDQLQIKFDYLEALVHGASGDLVKYEEKLKNVASAYPSTEIGGDAEEKIKAIDKKRNPEKYKEKEPDKFTITLEDGMYFLLKTKDVKDINRFKTLFSNYNRKEFSLEKLELTSFIYDKNEYIVLVKNFSNMKVAKDYLARAKKHQDFLDVEGTIDNYVLISKDNFSEILESKSYDEYKEAFLKVIN